MFEMVEPSVFVKAVIALTCLRLCLRFLKQSDVYAKLVARKKIVNLLADLILVFRGVSPSVGG